MSVWVFSNQKGGVGKTTLSVLFAHWLSQKQESRVCVIDLDSQCNCSKTLAAFSGGKAIDLFAESDASEIGRWSQSAGITLLEGCKRLADVELDGPEAVIPRFRKRLLALSPQFDHVVIDTPPALGLRMSAALIAADAVVCPIELEEYSISGVTDMLITIFGVQRRYNPGLHFAGIVANRFNAHSLRQKAALRELISHYSEFVVPAKISTRSSIPEGLASGMPVWELGRTSAREASEEVLRVFEAIQERVELKMAPPREKAAL